jgi:hypothetical protein
VQTVRNALPVARSRANVNPLANASFGLVTPELAQQLISGLNKDILAQLDDNRKFQDSAVDSFVDAIRPRLTDLQRKELADAIKSGNAAKVKLLLPKGLSPNVQTRTGDLTQWYSEFNKLDNDVRQGKRASTLAPQIARLKTLNSKLAGSNSGNAFRFDPVLRQLKQRDALFDAFTSSGTLVSTTSGLPLGPTTVMFFPQVPPGIVMIAGNAFITGGPLEIQTTTTAQVLGLPVGTSEPLTNGNGELGVGLTLVNPKKNGVAFNYSLDKRSKSLSAGQAESFTDGPEWVVEYDRGEGSSTAYHLVVAGSYEFTVADKQWDLQKRTYETTIDNTDNSNVFHYVINGEQATIAAHGSNSHKSEYPPVIKFDIGTGEDRTKQVTEAKAIYRVGVNSSSNTWDLFNSVAPGGIKSNTLATPKSLVTPATSLNLGVGLTKSIQQ